MRPPAPPAITHEGRRDLPLLRALLLDLDDTLLINDMDSFGPAYCRALLGTMRSICPPVRFMEALQAGTEAMMGNDGRSGPNAEVFAREFLPRVGRSAEDIMPIFERFYREEFDGLRSLTEVDPDAKRLVALARQQGYQLAIATQPLFPREAILARLRWAGVPDEEWRYDFVASYESLSACKPRWAYFRTILDRLGRRPDECLVVGDSPQADMAAGRFGLKTYWVDRGRGVDPSSVQADARGNLLDLIHLIETGEVDDL